MTEPRRRPILTVAVFAAVSALIFFAFSNRDPTITAEGNDWTPVSLTVSVGDDLVVRNSDLVVHTFLIEDLEIDLNIVPGRDRMVTIEEPGTYRFVCDVTGHTGMVGTIEATG